MMLKSQSTMMSLVAFFRFMISILISLSYGGANAAALTTQEYLENPNQFFLESNPALVFEDNEFLLQLVTPLPVLCAIHYQYIGVADDDDDLSPLEEVWDVRTMEMTSPAEIHSVQLPFDEGNPPGKYQIHLTAFLPGEAEAILISSPYIADTRTATTSQPTLVNDFTANATSLTNAPDCPYSLVVDGTSVGSATIDISEPPSLPTIHSLSYGMVGGEYTNLARESSTTAIANPGNALLSGLQSETEYNVVGCFVDTTRDICCTGSSTFTTATEQAPASGEACFGTNVALLSEGAYIRDVSSNWSNQNNDGSFGANKAIDGMSGTAWSSSADGDNAWIEVGLSESHYIAGVGVWSRTMVTSSVITSFQLTLSSSSAPQQDLVVIGPLALEDANQLYKYDLASSMTMMDDAAGVPLLVDTIRLDVVTSTQFNTGLQSLEVYPLLESCLPNITTTSPAPAVPGNDPTPSPDMDDAPSPGGDPTPSPESDVVESTTEPSSSGDSSSSSVTLSRCHNSVTGWLVLFLGASSLINFQE